MGSHSILPSGGSTFGQPKWPNTLAFFFFRSFHFAPSWIGDNWDSCKFRSRFGVRFDATLEDIINGGHVERRNRNDTDNYKRIPYKTHWINRKTLLAVKSKETSKRRRTTVGPSCLSPICASSGNLTLSFMFVVYAPNITARSARKLREMGIIEGCLIEALPLVTFALCHEQNVSCTTLLCWS